MIRSDNLKVDLSPPDRNATPLALSERIEALIEQVRRRDYALAELGGFSVAQEAAINACELDKFVVIRTLDDINAAALQLETK